MKKFTIAFLALILFTKVFATHNRAGEILYKRIAPFQATVNSVPVPVYNYEITIVKYCDYGPAVADRCVDTVYFGDGTRGIAPRTNGNTYTCGCGLGNTAIPCGTIILAQPGYIVNKSNYVITHTYPGPGNYLVHSYDPNRNQGVVNVPNSVSEPFYIESLIVINAGTSTNSSPVPVNAPIGIAHVGSCYYHNPGVTDADGDSLSFDMTTCKTLNGATISGYTFPTFNANGYFFINAVTGLISWCSPVQMGEYNIAFVIREWRKNSNGVYQQNGYMIRDMQVIVDGPLLGLYDQSEALKLQLSPNPFNQLLNLEFPSSGGLPTTITITGPDGQIVYSTQLNAKVNSHIINTESFAKGIYFLHVITGNQIVTKKLIKD